MTLSQILKTISKKEWRFVILLVLALILITNFTLVYGYLVTPRDQIFTGIHFAAPNDWFIYYSYLEQVRQGNLLFKDLYTTEPHLPVLNIFWLGIGLLAKIFNLGNVLAFNLAKIFLTPIFFFVVYLFLAYIFSEVKKRKVALLILSFASGLGFFLINQLVKYPYNFASGRFNWPMDLWVPESNVFLTLYYSPHFIAALTLILLIFFLTILFVENNRVIYSLAAGVSGLLLFAFHPFHVITIFGVIFIYFAILSLREKKIIWQLVKHFLILTTISLPAIIYYLSLLRVDWLTQQRALQNKCFTTPLWLTLFSFGLLLILALIGVYILSRQQQIDKRFLFLITWAVVQFLVIYLPVNYQRRMTAGLQFPLVVLTTVGFFGIYSGIKQRQTKLTKIIFSQRYALVILLVALFISSNLFQIAADVTIYREKMEFAYLDQEIVAAAKWLKSVGEDKIIFNSAGNVINIVPAYSGRRVYVGHGVETAFFALKQQEVDWFFQKNRSETLEQSFLAKRNISYIFYSETERRIGSYTPQNKSYLKAVYSNKKVQIYQVL